MDPRYEGLEELLGELDYPAGSLETTLATGGRGMGAAAAATHFRPGESIAGYPGMPVSPQELRNLLPGVGGREAMEIGQERMANREPPYDPGTPVIRSRGPVPTTGHRGSTAHHPNRRPPRP